MLYSTPPHQPSSQFTCPFNAPSTHPSTDRRPPAAPPTTRWSFILWAGAVFLETASAIRNRMCQWAGIRAWREFSQNEMAKSVNVPWTFSRNVSATAHCVAWIFTVHNGQVGLHTVKISHGTYPQRLVALREFSRNVTVKSVYIPWKFSRNVSATAHCVAWIFTVRNT